METYRFTNKHNAELFQYSIVSKNSGHYKRWTAKLDGFTVTTDAPQWVIDSAYKDLGAYGRDPARRRRASAKKTSPAHRTARPTTRRRASAKKTAARRTVRRTTRRGRRDVSRADLKHLSGAALLKLLRQAVRKGDEDMAEAIGKELDRRSKF